MAVIYDEAVPPDSQKAGLGAQRLRELTENVEDTIGVDHIVDSTDEGMHKKATIGNADAPVAGVTNKIILYGDDVDAVAELHTMDENDDIIQYSSQGNLCVTNTKQPAAGEANKILLYAEDNGDSKAKLMAIDEDDNVTPLEGYVLLDSDATVRTTSSESFVAETNLTGTFTGAVGEIYECIISGLFKVTAGDSGVVKMYDSNSRADFYASGGGLTSLGFGLTVANSGYLWGAVKGFLKITSAGGISLRQYWAGYGSSPTIYCDNRFMYIRRVV